MNPNPILVVDKKGIIGEAICQELVSRSLVIYVSQKQPQLREVEFVMFGREAPVIPNYIYSHIIVIDDGYTPESHLDEFAKKAEKDRASLVFTTNLAKLASFYKRAKDSLGRAKIVVLGDIISRSVCPLLVYSAIKFGRIKIANDGLSKTYPVFLGDVVSGIIDATFDKNTKTSVFCLFPKHPPTELSLARQIQKANPTVQVDFTKGPRKEQEYQIPVNGKYLLPDNYPLKKKIRELNIEGLMGRNFNKDSFNRNTYAKGTKLLSFRIFLLGLFSLLILPLVSTLIFSLLGLLMLGYTKSTIEKGDLSNAQKSASVAKIFFSLAKKASIPLLIEGKFIGQEKNLEQVTKNISLGSYLSQMAIYITDGSKNLSEVFAGISKNPKKDFTKGAKDLKSAITIFRQIEAEGKLPEDLQVKTKSADSLIKIAENTIDYMPNLFGFNGKRIYLVLFQNNMELRPGGGFIGSYGLLTFDDGKMVDFSIHDVYDADGQLRGHVEPPYPIRRYLKLPHLYLRDSNFDVDFAKGASTSAILLNAETGQMVDGVIGIDVSFVKNILEAIGPVYVSDYKETVTSSNLYELTQSHAEKNFFPGSRQKKDFLRSLFVAMQLRLSANNSLPYLEIAKSIDEAITQKHFLFAFGDKNLQDLFTVNKWSSALWDERRENPSSINDFLGINEANIGVNKANYFVKRNVIHNVMIDENGNTEGEIRIEYKNTSSKWPGGDYVNYLRIILPLNTTISSISFDGVSQDIVPAITDPLIYEAKDFTAPLGLELERYEQSGKTIYGFIVNVEAGKSKEIKIGYLLPEKISLESQAFFYQLRIFKQPGIDSYPYSFLITYPKDLKIISGSSLSFLDLVTDKELKIDFAKKN